MSEFQVEVYQTRPLSDYVNDDRTGPKDGFEAMYHDIRDASAGFIDVDDIDHAMFTRLWTLAGGDTIEADSIEDARARAFEQWNNGSGRESEAFRQANEEHRAVSMSAGDILRIDGEMFFCAPVGWEDLDL